MVGAMKVVSVGKFEKRCNQFWFERFRANSMNRGGRGKNRIIISKIPRKDPYFDRRQEEELPPKNLGMDQS